MAVLEGCRKECSQVTARVLPLLTGQSAADDNEYKGLSESFHMSLRLCTKIAGLVVSDELVPLILVAGTTFTQLSLLVAVECGPSPAHLVTSKDAIMKLWHCLKMKGGPVSRVSVQSFMEKLSEIFELVQEGSCTTTKVPGTWMLQTMSQWCLLLSLLCLVNGEVGFAKELVRSRSVRSSECMTSTILVRDLEHLLASGCDGSTQALGNNTSSMSCAVKGTSEPAKPCACSDINSPLLKVWMCIEQGAHGSALTVIYKELQRKPKLPELYHLMAGWCHFAMSKYNLALIHFSSCLSCEQLVVCGMECMSMCYRRLDQFELELKMLHHLCEATTQPVNQRSTISNCILICLSSGNWVLSRGAIISNVPSNIAARYCLAKRNLQLNRVAESTIQLRSLLQSMPEHPLMPDNRRLVAAIYLIAIKAFIQERECKEAMDLCEMMSSAFSCEGIPSGIPYGLDTVEIHTVMATATFLKGRALMCFVECRAAEALEWFERAQTMISSVRRESLHMQQTLKYIDQLEMMTANSLAICLVRLGRNEAALASLTSYLANHTFVQAEIMYNYCQLLRAKGLLLEAAMNWLKFRQILPKNEKECEKLLHMHRMQDRSLSCGTPDDVALLCSKYDVDWLQHCAVHKLWKEFQ